MDSRRSPPPTCPSLPSSSTGDRSASKSCAACRFQHKKCKGDCPLAPFLPAADESKFLKAHRLFGVRRMQKILERLPLHQCMDTMIYESEMRAAFPATGCMDIILQQHTQIERKAAHLALLRRQLSALAPRTPSCDGEQDTYRRPRRLPEEWN